MRHRFELEILFWYLYTITFPHQSSILNHMTPFPQSYLFFIIAFYILSTGLNPKTRIPLFSTCLAATYSANRAIITFRSLPTTCR